MTQCANPEYCTEGPAAHNKSPECAEGAPGVQFLAVKWSLDGATTLADAAQRAREYAAGLQALHNQGYVLEAPFGDGQAAYYKPAK